MPSRTRGMATILVVLVPFLLIARVGNSLAESSGPDSESGMQSTSTSYRSPARSLGLSLGGTAALFLGGVGVGALSSSTELGVGLALAGLAIGPSLGHFYSADYTHGVLTSLGRGTMGGFATLALINEIGRHGGNKPFLGSWEADEAVGLVCLAGWAGLTVWDFIDSWFAAGRFNQKAEENQPVIGPMVLPPPPGTVNSGPGIGLTLAWSF